MIPIAYTKSKLFISLFLHAKVDLAISINFLTLEKVTQEIHKLTGWACTIIIGGPMPKLGGAIQSLV